MKRIAVFASGNGSNFAALAAAVRRGSLACRICLLVCDNPRAGVLTKARRCGVPVLLAERERFADRESFEQGIIARLRGEKADLVVLAGFMRMLSPAFVRAFRNRILNIHPALLPSFKGSHAIRDALEYGVKVTGVTVHFVDEEMDHGPIIMQEALPLRPQETVATLEARMHRLEHRIYPRAIALVLAGKTRLAGRNVRLT